MLTADQHADLTTRLVALVSEYAAASQRREATDKVLAILATVPIAEPVAEPAAVTSETHDTAGDPPASESHE